MVNKRIQMWFTEGRLKEAILGDDNYRIPNVTFRESHDRLLIMGELLDWVNQRPELYLENLLRDILIELLNERFEDAIDTILCYFLVKPYGPPSIKLDIEWLELVVSKAIKKQDNGAKVCSDDSLRGQIVALSSYLPGIMK